MRCLLIVCILFIACNKSTVSNCSKDQYSYKFIPLSKIDTTTNSNGLFYQVTAGSNLVFTYTHTSPNCKNIVDEGFTKKLVFSVPSSGSDFTYTGSQLASGIFLFQKICFCPINTSLVTSGSISGTKISEKKWDININIDIPGTADKLIMKKIFEAPRLSNGYQFKLL